MASESTSLEARQFSCLSPSSSTNWIRTITHRGQPRQNFMKNVWRALLALSAVKTCYSCECCLCITNLLSNPNAKCMLGCQPYATCKHKLPISHCLPDNSWAFQNFMKNMLCIRAELSELFQRQPDTYNSHCLQQWNEWKYFKDDKKYEKFYTMLCYIMFIM